jgi:hypothetical protein
MKSIRIGAVALVVLAVAGLIAGCGSSSSHGEEGTLTLTEPGNKGSFGFVGHPTKKGVSPGSGFAFGTPLENSSRKTVGELNAICIATAASPPEALHGTCTGTAIVPGGSFSLNVGGKSIGENVSGAIVGGTGKYEGALGGFSSKSEGGAKTGNETLTFNYILP